MQMEQEVYAAEGLDWTSVGVADNTTCVSAIAGPQVRSLYLRRVS